MTLSRALCVRLSAVGLKKEKAQALTDQILHWYASSGPEWTIARLKDIKSYYVKRLSGEEWTPSIWIKTRKDGSLKGVFGDLPMESTKDVVRSFMVLQCYTYFISKQITDKQFHKFMDSLEASDVSLPSIKSTREFVNKKTLGQIEAQVPVHRERLQAPRLFTEYVWSPNKRTPLLQGACAESQVDCWVSDILRSGVIRNEVLRHKALATPSGFTQYCYQITGHQDGPVGGAIGFIQEPGFKLRAVANPFRVWQVMLDPLKQWAFASLRQQRCDCTFDQSAGVRAIQEWLKEGRSVHCFDLSDATNNFPLMFQVEVLSRRLDLTDKVTNQSVDLFASISRSTWRCLDREVVWTRGQPLGLGPSFAVFALAHHQVLRDCGGRLGNYVLLGDDIAIADDSVASKYSSAMERMKIPISRGKSLSSKRVAEFGGKLILPDFVISLGKFRKVSDRNFLDVVRALGPQSVGLLQTRQKRVVRKLAELPDFLGGLGWNPAGKPLSERIELAAKYGLLDEKQLARMPFRALTTVTSQTLNKLALEHNLEWRQDLTWPRIHHRSPTRTTLQKVISATHIKEGVYPVKDSPTEMGRDLTPLSETSTSDPRGSTMLTTWLDRLGLESRRTSKKDRSGKAKANSDKGPTL